MVKPKLDDPKFLKVPLKKPILDSMSNHGRHAII
jgi:hypothetical protein